MKRNGCYEKNVKYNINTYYTYIICFKYVDIFNKLKKKSGFGPRATEMDLIDFKTPPSKRGHDDQSRELAKSKFEMGEYAKDPTKKSK